jgi:hypothetical protein
MQGIIKLLKYFIVYPAIAVLLIVIFTIFIRDLITEPSNDRNWNEDQMVLPSAMIKDNLITIKNVRNFKYASTTSFVAKYYDETYDLNKLIKVWYVVEPFSGIPGSAHTFLSFEFENDKFVSISVEIRKEKGEKYHPVKGLFNQYELMYVIADEKDVIKLRSNYRKDLVYVYPIRAPKEKMKSLFVDMLERANHLRDNPEFYNTITNTCITNIVAHVNKITPKRIPFFNLRILLPANSDKLAYKLGLIDTNLPFEEARKKYYINDRAIKYENSNDFSRMIREE